MSQKQIPGYIQSPPLFPLPESTELMIRKLVFSDSSETDEHENNDLDTSNSFDGYSSPVPSPPTQSSPTDGFGSIADHFDISRLKKRLNFEEDEDNYKKTSPPNQGMRKLRLFESPTSPKTLLKESQLSSVDSKKRVVRRLNRTPELFDKNHNVQSRIKRTSVSIQYNSPEWFHQKNPFNTSEEYNMCSTNNKRRRRTEDSGYLENLNNSLDRSYYENETEDYHPKKRLHVRTEITLPRYESDFCEIECVGSGQFGSVYKCLNKMDGCLYAIKKSKQPINGTCNERRALNEVFAHAVLGTHKHVVRYYTAWAENDHMLIQNEYCNGGSLADAIEEKTKQNIPFSRAEATHILKHVTLGLRHIHSLNLVHMDIKPGNIFMTGKKRPVPISQSSSDDGFEDEDFDETDLIYKIGDLGHVTSIVNPVVEEGDCRYLSPELMRDEHTDLPKVDIFALGMTMYEVCGGGPLPKNGDEWHDIRRGNIKYLDLYSKEFNNLIKLMIDPDPKKRPSTLELLNNENLVPYANKSKEQLSRELNEEKIKNMLLSRQLELARVCMDDRENKIVVSPLKNSNTNIDKRERKFVVSQSTREKYAALNVGKVKRFMPKNCSRLIGKGVARSNSSTF